MEATILAVIEAVRRAPPSAFSGGGKWEAMHGSMGGYYETRRWLPGHAHASHCGLAAMLDDDLYGNVAAHIWACRYGIALFEDRRGRGLNENMIIEVGSMVITGRRCALMKDTTIAKLPTDFSGQLYRAVDFGVPATVTASPHRWAAEDLGRGRCAGCA